MDCEVDNENMIDIFGKKYAECPHEFRFERGAVLLIKEIVAHVIQIVDGNGKNSGLRRFKYKFKSNEKDEPLQRKTICSKSSIKKNDDSTIDEKRLSQLRTQLYKKGCGLPRTVCCKSIH